MNLKLKQASARRIDPSKFNIFIAPDTSKKAIEGLAKTWPQALKNQLKEALKGQKAKQHFLFSASLTEGGVVALIAECKEARLSALHSQMTSMLSAGFKKTSIKEVLLFLPKEDVSQRIEDLVFLSLVSNWTHPKRKTKEAKPESGKSVLVFSVLGQKVAKLNEAFKRGVSFGEAACLVKTLSHTPPNFLTPELFAKEAKAIALKRKWHFEFLDEKKLKKLGAGAFLAVSQGSSKRDSGIVHITINSKAKKNGKFSFVGKGICYDTGGYNVKTGSGMFNMHQDMTGAAQALAMGMLCDDLGLEKEIHIYLALAENHISADSFKMNDVVYASNGKSIEVIHTDAEGRMVLSDTLAIASKEEPELMMDYATLTGSAIRAVGTKRACVFVSSEDGFIRSLSSAQATGEEVWPFPQGQEYEEGLKSKIADIKQCEPGHNSDHIYATTFLAHFVTPKTHWVHMDLSPVDGTGAGLVPLDGCGFGLRWSYDYLRQFSSGVKQS
ncbi:leucyl aminopeptidase family protein [bacterium]|nr:leucyl aminopeptidase family protein [bacterium]